MCQFAHSRALETKRNDFSVIKSFFRMICVYDCVNIRAKGELHNFWQIQLIVCGAEMIACEEALRMITAQFFELVSHLISADCRKSIYTRTRTDSIRINATH